jgi:hypothetical protein
MNRIKNVVIGIAVFVLTLLVGIYGVNTFYIAEPRWEDYCPHITLETECIEIGGNWVNYSYENNGFKEQPIVPARESGYCDLYPTCQENYETAREKYSRGLFFIALPLGIVVVAVGALVFGLETVGGGLMFGGVGIIIYGTSRFWDFAQDWFKFALSLVGLAAVIWIAYYLNKRSNK